MDIENPPPEGLARANIRGGLAQHRGSMYVMLCVCVGGVLFLSLFSEVYILYAIGLRVRNYAGRR